jgi:basic membrane protein A
MLAYILYAAPKGDKSYSDSVYAGLFQAQEEYDFMKKEYTIDDITELDDMFSSGAFKSSKNPDLVIVVGYTYEEHSQKWAELNPNIDFLLIDHRQPDLPNARTLEITTFGASYLAGVLADNITQTNKVGVILGTKTWVLEDFSDGFEAGARDYNPEIVLDVKYIAQDDSGFRNPDEGKRLAYEMYNSGYDVIYAAAGGSVIGIVEAAKANDSRYVIGVDWDQTYLGPNVVIASVVKNLDSLIYQTIADYLQGIFEPGIVKMGLEESMTGLIFNPKFEWLESEVMQFYGNALAEENKLISQRP